MNRVPTLMNGCFAAMNGKPRKLFVCSKFPKKNKLSKQYLFQVQNLRQFIQRQPWAGFSAAHFAAVNILPTFPCVSANARRSATATSPATNHQP